MTLRDLPVGKTATIRSVGGEGALRQLSGYGTDSTGRGNSSKVRSHGRSGGTADSQL